MAKGKDIEHFSKGTFLLHHVASSLKSHTGRVAEKESMVVIIFSFK